MSRSSQSMEFLLVNLLNTSTMSLSQTPPTYVIAHAIKVIVVILRYTMNIQYLTPL